jgi:hypothetical protein
MFVVREEKELGLCQEGWLGGMRARTKEGVWPEEVGPVLLFSPAGVVDDVLDLGGYAFRC